MPKNIKYTDDDMKNKDFVQFSRKAMSGHRSLIKKSQIAAEVLSLLVESMNRQNAVVCSFVALKELTGYGRTSLSKAIKVLKEDGWIQVLKIGTANAYVVNSAAFWTTYANGKIYSSFHAAVIVSESEQELMAKEMSKIKLRNVPIWHVGEKPVEEDDQRKLDS